MALIRCDFFSDVLALSTSMTVLLPQQTSSQIGMPGTVRTGDAPVLYLLHGLSDDATTWLRRTSVERYVSDLGLAVVMPQVGRSFYTDEEHGDRYLTFLSEELPELVRTFFRVSERREDTFVAGLSMGGYGAMKWALRQPERFAAAASLSGALDVGRLVRERTAEEYLRLYDHVFGDRPVQGSDDDLLALLSRADVDALPPLFVGCGTEDELHPDNVRFIQAARAAGAQVSVDLGPGEHEWAYWDEQIQRVLAWLPLR